MEHDGLMIGMFYGGVVMALVPVSLGVGVAIYVLRRYLEGRNASPPDD